MKMFVALPLLLLAAAPASANPWLDRCLKAEGDSTTLADACRRAADYGGLSSRQQAVAWTNVGVALSEMGRDGDALSAFERAELADPRFVPIYTNRALALSRRGREDEALADWSRAADLSPGAAEPLVGRATLLLQSGRAQAALQDLDRAVAVDPESADAHYNRGVTLMQLGRAEEAARAFGQVLRIDPQDAAAHLQRGAALLPADPQAALADFDAALRLSPGWAAAWATRGQAHEKLGRTEAASTDYRRAFELGYQAPWLNRRIEALGG